MNEIQIKLNGTDISNFVNWQTLQVSLVLTKEVSKVQMDIVQKAGAPAIKENDQVDVYQNSIHIFGGTITTIKDTILGGVLPTINYTATDWSFKLNSKLVAKTYAQMDPHDIVLDILANFTDGTYTTNNVQMGNFNVASLKLNYEPVTKSIQKLAQLIGWDWYVDASKDVHFFLAENHFAPFDIDDTSGNLEWPTLDIERDLTNMKNSVYVIGGNYEKIFTSTTTPDVYQTDGVRQVFGLAYPYDKKGLTITLAGVVQTFGIANQVSDPSTVQVLYDEKNRYVQFTTTPAANQTVQIYGKARVPIIAHSSDAVGIYEYGENQDSIVDRQITTVSEAQQRAKAEIMQYGHAVYTVKFNTLQPGLQVGQTIMLQSPKRGYTNIPLIIKRITGNGYSPTQIEWSVEAYGSDQVTFTDMMSSILIQENRDNPVEDSTVLEVLQLIDEQINLVETISVISNLPPYQWGPGGNPQGRWGFSTWS